MKIKTKILETFLTELRMKTIQSCMFEFNEDGLQIYTLDLSKSHMSKGLLKKEAFTEYAAIGNVGIDELQSLIQIFKRLGTELEYNVEGNLLIAKGAKKELRFELLDEKFIDMKFVDGIKKFFTIEYPSTFNIDTKTMQDFLDDVSLNKDCSIYFETVNEGLKLYNDGKYKFTHNIDSKGTVGGELTKFGEPMINVLKDLKSGDLKCHIKTDTPMRITRETEFYTIDFFVAPLVNDGKQQ